MTSNPKKAWDGLKKMTGNIKSTPSICDDEKTTPEEQAKLASDLNKFYTRFEDDSRGPSPCRNKQPHTADMFTLDEVLGVLQLCKPGKAPGPDTISNTLLRTCACQLAPVFHTLFNICMQKGQLPMLWKTSTIKPIPKKPFPKVLNDYRPVALTSNVMKCFEKLIKSKLAPYVEPTQDALQFAYKSRRSTTDACAILQQLVIGHTDKLQTYARILFIDYSSAFNTIVPSKLLEKLERKGVDERLYNIIASFLSNRSQNVMVNKHLSPSATPNTGAPQGCVLSPLLFTVYTDDLCSEHDNVHILKYADDTAVVGLITKAEETGYRCEVEKVRAWCEDHNLILNTSKTKEMVVNFTHTPTTPLQISGTSIDSVETFKYLGVTFDSKMCFKDHVDTIVAKCNTRLYLLRTYSTFGATAAQMLRMFNSMVLSVITYACQAFYSILTKTQKDRLQDIAKRAKITTDIKACVELQQLTYM